MVILVWILYSKGMNRLVNSTRPHLEAPASMNRPGHLKDQGNNSLKFKPSLWLMKIHHPGLTFSS